jgi:hypothetical protein
MDGLEISRTLETGRALRQEAEQKLVERGQIIRGILDKRDTDLKNASDKTTSDDHTDWAEGGIGGGETMYRLATSGAQAVSDLKSAGGVADFFGKEYERSLGKSIVGGVSQATGWVGKQIGMGQGADGLSAGAGDSEFITYKQKNDPLPGFAGGLFEGPSDEEKARVLARSQRVSAGQRFIQPRFGDADPIGASPLDVGGQNRIRAQAQSLAARDLGQQRSLSVTGGAQQEAQSQATELARQNAPKSSKTFQPADAIPEDVVASNPETLKSIQAEKTAAALKGPGVKDVFQAGQDFLNHPVTKSIFKVTGNIQGGEDIYDFFDDKSAFNSSGAGAEFSKASHVLDSLGTVSDVIGTFVPGMEEVGAVLNIAGSVSQDIGQWKDDKASASLVNTQAQNKINQVNAQPIQISAGLQNAGLVASAQRHIQNQSNVGTF